MTNQEKNDRFITVKGTGKVVAKPDLTIISFTLVQQTMEYEKTMELATNEIELLRKALISIGYDRKSLKTTDFNVSTEYTSINEGNGRYRQEFKGYRCSHRLILEFDFDMKRLSETLSVISKSGTKPVFGISFSVKDKNAVSEELIRKAVEDAREKAIILSEAAGVSLGAVQTISYRWEELEMYSRTNYSEREVHTLAMRGPIEIEPEDIKVSDTVSVVWSIE